MDKVTNVAVGLSTWIGIVAASAAAIIPLIGDLADAAEPLGVAPGVWIVVSAALYAATIIGRMAQAIAITLREPKQ